MQMNENQEKVINAAIDWFNNSSEQVFQYSGPAGTGKSVVMNEIIRRLKLSPLDVAPMAYTGTAAMVMASKGMFGAKTIHGWLYKPEEIPTGEIDPVYNKPKYIIRFVPVHLPINIRLVCVDEGSYVPAKIAKELLSRNVKVLVCGDINQLPPVNADNSDDNKQYFLCNGKVHYLTEIMRQNEGSGIVYLANRILEGKPVLPGNYNEVTVCYANQVPTEFIHQTEVVISGFNKTRDYYNNFIRKLRGYNTDLPSNGETVICRKNKWNIINDDAELYSLVNGMIGKVHNFPDISGFDGKYFTMDFLPKITKIPFRNLKVNYKYFKAGYIEKNKLRSNKFELGEFFDYGYAITAHLSQGSQFDSGLFIQERFRSPEPDFNKHLWYTGITRFTGNGQCYYALPARRNYF